MMGKFRGQTQGHHTSSNTMYSITMQDQSEWWLEMDEHYQTIICLFRAIGAVSTSVSSGPHHSKMDQMAGCCSWGSLVTKGTPLAVGCPNGQFLVQAAPSISLHCAIRRCLCSVNWHSPVLQNNKPDRTRPEYNRHAWLFANQLQTILTRQKAEMNCKKNDLAITIKIHSLCTLFIYL